MAAAVAVDQADCDDLYTHIKARCKKACLQHQSATTVRTDDSELNCKILWWLRGSSSDYDFIPSNCNTGSIEIGSEGHLSDFFHSHPGAEAVTEFLPERPMNRLPVEKDIFTAKQSRQSDSK